MKNIIYVRKDGKEREIPTPDFFYNLMVKAFHGMPNCNTYGPQGHFVCTRKCGHIGPHIGHGDHNRVCAIWKQDANA